MKAVSVALRTNVLWRGRGSSAKFGGKTMWTRAARVASLIVVVGALVVLAACSGGTAAMNNSSTVSPGQAQVSVTLGDAPPSGVTVLSFEVTINSASLLPGNVPLVSNPQRLEITKLETETAFLNTAGVTPGTYTGISVAFSNPELTILNNTGAAIGSCAAGSVCELKPPLVNTSVTFSGMPFPITIAAGSPMGLLVDLDLVNSIQSSLSINPTITLSQLPAAVGGELKDIDEVVGQVTAKDTTNNTITLQVGGSSGKSLIIKVDSNTRFEEFEEEGMTSGFAAIAVGQFLKVNLKLMPDGSFVAKEIELAEKDAKGELEGVITMIGTNQFQMVILDEEPELTAASTGNTITVNVQAGAVFNIDQQGLPLPSGAAFTGVSNLMVGQHVQIRPTAAPSGTPLSVTTDRIRLRNSRLTAQVTAINGSTLTLGSLPALFTGATPAVTQIQVESSSQTHFDGVTGISGLAAGNTVSVSGLLFNTTGTPTLEAKKIRKR